MSETLSPTGTPPEPTRARFHDGHVIGLHMVIELARQMPPTGDVRADRNAANAIVRASEVLESIQLSVAPLAPSSAATTPLPEHEQEQLHQEKTMKGQLESSSARDATGGYASADAFGLLRSYSRHVAFVRLALTIVGQALERRALAHDASKMLDDEFAGFARINAAARINKFGSPEYAESMQRERTTIDLHFSRNSHHPERPNMLMEADPDTHVTMTFLDVIEMVCDWWGARRGYDDHRPWEDSVKLNLATKGKYLSIEQLWLAREVAAFLAREDSNV